MLITQEDIVKMEQRYRTMFINSVSGYKSLQMVGTSSTDGISNLALVNSVFHVGANPPLLGMVFRPEGLTSQDTLKNIMETGQCTLNNILPEWYERAHQTSARYGRDESEFDLCGFKKAYLNKFKAPFVEESTIKIGLEIRDIIEVSLNNTNIVIGEIICLILDEQLIATDGYVDIEKAGSVTVAGLDSYFTTQALGRLTYARPGKYPERLSVEQ